MLKKQIIPIVRAFQSALPRGERRTRSYNPTACKQFQSALPRGERQQIGGSLDEDRNISIHAPARGATVSLVTRDSAHKHFNPRSREGSDNRLEAVWMKTEIFQSTLPRGERHLRREIQRQFIHNFNPRSREGSDKAQHIQETVQDNFNPRSREGSDLGNLVHVLAITIFSTHFLQVFIISIRAPARGATVNVSIPLSPHLFQSALPRGERP